MKALRIPLRTTVVQSAISLAINEMIVDRKEEGPDKWLPREQLFIPQQIIDGEQDVLYKTSGWFFWPRRLAQVRASCHLCHVRCWGKGSRSYCVSLTLWILLKDSEEPWNDRFYYRPYDGKITKSTFAPRENLPDKLKFSPFRS